VSLFYDLIFFLIGIIYLPIYLFKGKFHKGFSSRLGILPDGLKLNRPIWLHAVSVGEAMAVKKLITELRRVFPDKRIAISTVTPTGNKIVRELAKDSDYVFYLPLDFSFIVRRVVKKLNPSLFIAVETEFWPNLISRLYKEGIPTAIVNARISDSSFRGYSAGRIFIKPILLKINLFLAQTNVDAQRLMALGVSGKRIRTTGNMKFDNNPLAACGSGFNAGGMKAMLGLSDKDVLIVAGSTHRGEEEIIVSAYKALLNKYPHLKLLIAPRHPERTPEVSDIIVKYGFKPLNISELEKSGISQAVPKGIFILDTVGKLVSYYMLADIVFVGGSLVKKGGHNIIEPAVLGKAVLCCPHMFNFRDIYDLFVRNSALITVHNGMQLESEIEMLLSASEDRSSLGRKAMEVVLQNQGATVHNIKYIVEDLVHGSL